ncbi:MAG TPA: GNAT family N-acetyltransferase, partial [Ktedonobacter sp.]|nr:GNAT family N-acetyltransferase [Ktedonobacter sp.]
MSIANFTTIETTRLRLRHFTDSDLPVFIAYRNDPVVAKYQSWEGISEPEA